MNAVMRRVASVAIGLAALSATPTDALAQDTTCVVDTVVVIKVDTVIVVDTVVSSTFTPRHTVPQDTPPPALGVGDIYAWNFESSGPPRGDRFGWFTNTKFNAARHAPGAQIVEDGSAAEGAAYARTVSEQFASSLILVLGDVGPTELDDLFVSFLVRRSPGTGGKILRFFDRNTRSLGYLDVRDDRSFRPGSLHWVFDTGVPNSIHSQPGVVPGNRWVRLEVQYDANPGGKDIVRIWADGMEVLQVAAPRPSDRLIGLVVAPTNQKPVPGSGRSLDYDDFVFSTQRIGKR